MNEDFSYPHFATKTGERTTATSKFNKPKIPESFRKIRERAFEREIPVSSDETLCLLTTMVKALNPKRILEIGTAVGVSGAAMLLSSSEAKLVTVEKNEDFFKEASENFSALGLDDRVELILGDGGEVINGLSNQFDLIFLDSAKAQYFKYLDRLIELVRLGGVILADDVLLFGYVSGEVEVPKKRKMLVQHIREYIDLATNSPNLMTTVLDIGDGVAMSVRIK